ncbi:hypothetical protein B0E53_02166 [Micromonospora sp. MH33]|nr:hypothetical protein B0E53_02166 [Micromonospora sp. MH33]
MFQQFGDGTEVRAHGRPQPVRAGVEQLLAERPAQPGQFGAQGDRVQPVVAVEVEAELFPGAPLGVVEEQHQQLAVPATEPDPAAGHAQLRLVPAEGGDVRHVGFGGGGAGQERLGGPRGGPDQGQALRGGQVVPAGDVDRAEQPAGGRVVDRGGGAGPALHRPDEVLGGEDLHAVVDGQGGAGRVGAGVGLVPAGAGHEVHPLGVPEHPRVPLHPEQPSVRVADRHEVRAVLRDAAEQVAEEGQYAGQRVGGPVARQRVVGEVDRGGGLGVEQRGPLPRPAHHVADPAGGGAGGEERFVRGADLRDPLGRIGAEFQGEPRVSHRRPPRAHRDPAHRRSPSRSRTCR